LLEKTLISERIYKMINIHGHLFDKQEKFSKIFFEKWFGIRVIGFMHQNSSIITFNNLSELKEGKLYVVASTITQPGAVISLKNLVKINDKHYEFESVLMNEFTLSYSMSDTGNSSDTSISIEIYDDCDKKIDKITMLMNNGKIIYTFKYAFVKCIKILSNFGLSTYDLKTYVN
jgi:hypothetical protein